MTTSSTSSVTLLASVIKQLSSTGDVKSREFEKEKINNELKNADEKLAELVDANQDHLKKSIQSFGSVVARVQGCRARIKVLHEKLTRCRKLLHCNRDDLKTHWQEGLECTEKLNLLDKIEKAIAVPEKLHRYISKKHFLHASQLLVETVENLDGNLSNVEALRDLRASLHSRKAVLHETIIDELNKQIYSELSQKSVKKGSDSKPERVDPSKDSLFEDLQRDPEDNLPKFIYLMVESLLVLDKIPEAVESFKGRIKRDMLMVIRKSTDQVAKRSIEHGCGEVLAAEELSNKSNSQLLLELLQVTFSKFRSISMYHDILLKALKHVKSRLPAEKAEEINLYTNEDIWSKIQFAIKDMLHPYLDIQNSMPQQSLSSFGNPDGALGSFFTAKKRLNVGSSSKQKSQLFRFECSSSSEAIHSYMREQDIASNLHEDSYSDFIVWNAPQLLCKAIASNITVVFLPVVDFVKEIDEKTSSRLASNGVLFNFVSDFVEKIFLGQVLYEVSEKANGVTKGHDALRNLCDNHMQRKLNLPRPLLKSAVVIYQASQYLLNLMGKLPQYSTELMKIMNRILLEFYGSCHNSYKGLVFRDTDGKGSRIISANWVKDEDINRLMSSLPNWHKLHNPDETHDDNEDSKTVRSKEDKEVDLLIANLEKVDIEKSQVILDFSDLKSIANLQESAEWLANNIRDLVTSITGQSIKINVDSFDSPRHSSLTPQSIHSSDDSIKELERLEEIFRELANNCLILLHLEIRFHCFYYIGKATRESSYFITMDSIEVDSQIPPLVKELRDMEDLCSSALPHDKVRYLFDGLSYLIACILISSTSYIKKINRSGVKKMCQNIFTIQQELANITTRREWNLDVARQYFELLYLSPDEILNVIHEQGSYFKEQDYANALELLSRSEVPFDKDLWRIRREKLSEILKESEEK